MLFKIILYTLNNIRNDPPYEYYLYVLTITLGVFFFFVVSFLLWRLFKQKCTEQLPSIDDELIDLE